MSGNTEAFLRALYLQLALGPKPPAVRADLLLLLVDELRISNPARWADCSVTCSSNLRA